MEAHAEPHEPNERDTTDEWRIAPARRLTSVAELEDRIDVALATARTAEEAALEIGAASLEAAEQARRAAALAERASASAADAAASVRQASVTPLRPEPEPSSPAPEREAPVPEASDEPSEPVTAAPPASKPPAPVPERAAPVAAAAFSAPRQDAFEERLTAFRLRAERVMVRLQKIELGAAQAEGPSEVVRLG
jgi:hypothetical protein